MRTARYPESYGTSGIRTLVPPDAARGSAPPSRCELQTNPILADERAPNFGADTGVSLRCRSGWRGVGREVVVQQLDGYGSLSD